MATLGIEWAAGLFEGEGCIYLEQPAPNGKRYVRLVLSSTDLDVLEAFTGVVGCGRIFPHKGKASEGRRALNHKQLYAWRLSVRADVRRVIECIRPFMGERRLAKIEEAMVWL